jgi:hypothetical protein
MYVAPADAVRKINAIYNNLTGIGNIRSLV